MEKNKNKKNICKHIRIRLIGGCVKKQRAITEDNMMNQPKTKAICEMKCNARFIGDFMYIIII